MLAGVVNNSSIETRGTFFQKKYRRIPRLAIHRKSRHVDQYKNTRAQTVIINRETTTSLMRSNSESETIFYESQCIQNLSH